jgi:hypothetical protein
MPWIFSSLCMYMHVTSPIYIRSLVCWCKWDFQVGCTWCCLYKSMASFQERRDISTNKHHYVLASTKLHPKYHIDTMKPYPTPFRQINGLLTLIWSECPLDIDFPLPQTPTLNRVSADRSHPIRQLPPLYYCYPCLHEQISSASTLPIMYTDTYGTEARVGGNTGIRMHCAYRILQRSYRNSEGIRFLPDRCG